LIIELNDKLLDNYEKFPLFGLILFTRSHPHIVKVLKDDDYYAALDEISGNLLLVFATMLFDREIRTPNPSPEKYPLKTTKIVTNEPKGTFHIEHIEHTVISSGNMEPIWVDPSENKEIMSWFNIKDSREFPLFVLFAFENSIMCYKKYALRDSSVQEVFSSLEEVLSAISFELKDKMNDDSVSLFGKAKWEVSKLQFKRQLKDVAGVVSQFRGVTGA
jgi:hypothetical protein